MKKQVKKCCVLVIIPLILVSCSDDAVLLEKSILPNNKELLQSEFLNNDEIGQLAMSALRIFDKEKSNRYQKTSRASLPCKLVPIKEQHQSRLASEEALLYAVNYPDEGFALVSALREYPEVLAYIPHGEYDSKDVNNPGF